MVRLNEQTREEYVNHILLVLKENDKEQFREAFLELHPTDQMDIFSNLEKDQRQLVYAYLSAAEFAEVFQELDIDEQKNIAVELDDHFTAEMFNNMYADDVADYLSEIKDGKAKAILSAMDKADADDVKELLAYPPETAGAIMTKEYISLKATQTASEVIELLREQGPDAETIYYLYVVDEKDKLVGVISLRDLIIAPTSERIEDIMSSRVVSVEAHMDQEEVAKLIKKYDFLAAPVVTSTGELIGIVTVDDVIDVLEEEATEDLGEISAVRGATDVNVTAFTAAKKRSPWIILLMFFGLITAGVIGQFEETLQEIVLLAVFIPLIMDSAGNTGTQSLAVTVRALATGSLEKKGLWNTVKQEFGTGLMLGLICAVTLIIVVPFIYGYMIAFIVGVSLFLTLSIATVIGATVPLAINKLKLDPAIASGPFITTVNDILGLLIYFTIATTLINYL
ncbi:magnesium transporter [Alkalihalobacillus sp. BA299]|uniref:magnesium transporter n=1 Tax=Alkalihalobacillus sp. BA299 TaxID=2815938 RepID=UPI001ADB24BD|nr:magnesium transporter [Alkalihalobacillus sp. BA299]